MLFGLTEVALPSFSEAKRVQTLIQLLIRPSVGTGSDTPDRPVRPVLPNQGAKVLPKPH
jgi:hypothetical protein